jgi:3-hydroxyacyl-[acyl-carrier-protein] dehydratase
MGFSHMPFLMAIDKARFRTFVGPRAELAITAELEHEGSGYTVTKAAIAVEGQRICDASLRFKTMLFPEGMAQAMREQARRIGLFAEID